MARDKAKAVRKEDNEYVAVAKDGTELARAGALNVFDEQTALTPGAELTFAESHEWQQVGSMHRSGVLYIE